MDLHYFPDREAFDAARRNDDPVMVLVAFDGSEALAAGADEVMEHIILLRKLGRRDSEIDSYFRIVANMAGADWTFVCPSDYRGIKDRQRRIETFYNDGIGTIAQALMALGYGDIPIQVPKRYRRHWNGLTN